MAYRVYCNKRNKTGDRRCIMDKDHIGDCVYDHDVTEYREVMPAQPLTGDSRGEPIVPSDSGPSQMEARLATLHANYEQLEQRAEAAEQRAGAMGANYERIRDSFDELVSAIASRYGIKLTRTDEVGCDSGRHRWHVACLTCHGVLHEATTGPFAWHEWHRCLCKKCRGKGYVTERGQHEYEADRDVPCSCELAPMKPHAAEEAPPAKIKRITADLVDKIIGAVCSCHDGSDLWTHTRRDPEAFRQAVRAVLGTDQVHAEDLPNVDEPDEPVPMLLYCPMCGERHVDEGEFATKVHHTHACQNSRCGHVWRPAVAATVGVWTLPGFLNEAPRDFAPLARVMRGTEAMRTALRRAERMEGIGYVDSCATCQGTGFEATPAHGDIGVAKLRCGACGGTGHAR